MRYPYFRKHPNIVTKMPLNPLPSMKKESVPSYILRRQLWPACFFGGGHSRFSHSKLEYYTFFEVKTITQSPAFLVLGWKKKKNLFTALSESCNICHLLGSHAKRNHFIFQPSNRLCWKVSFREGDPCNFTNHPPKNNDKRQWDWRKQPGGLPRILPRIHLPSFTYKCFPKCVYLLDLREFSLDSWPG